ncbi:cobalamin adenosyltransferase [Rhodonellum psychrophilum GCM71 = DSM 17998]|uniref:Corrinoid adenosyltransferase n=2 Tax=Rhodonellum TaxID=336827 RepID=U5C2M5_9BACT|nr:MULTISPECIES: cob(I)yrinic acid a,c-diamide adenosyltransferase [Rhodonellum]ERM82417.1 cobalamin adenosyltransferase [Rhodonellum psychrophilum GCM71 = DSM 17998]MDO9553191.1 cob(I)yrinic acid a,c-diamide adenosyltransferase [Rhodonellum sp.]SDY88421.1 cob(I)alamin adenosyltransferase [Rhodonellum ikkaensis]
MKIYTKTGDSGSTSLFGGKRVSKAHLRIEAYGTVDEFNAFIGLLRDQEINQNRSGFLKEVQDRLFTIGATLASEPGKENLKKPDLHLSDLEALEKEIDLMEANLPTLRNFILPGGHQSVSFCHLARTVCRRTERCVIALMEMEPVDEIIIKYLNRLSDYLFVLGRLMAQELGTEEVTWKPRS